MGLILSNLKTPGVYIDEVSLLPPSIAGVETGIPAFIGHTQKTNRSGTPLSPAVSQRISSLREYEEYFGKAQPEDDLQINISDYLAADGTTVTKTTINASFNKSVNAGPSKYNLYYSIQLYFANGGGPCHIVSIGDYTQTGDFNDGLTALLGEDEPTMIVIPEAVSLEDGPFYSLYAACLKQCADLKDRVVIMDVKQTNSNSAKDVTAFRAGNIPNDYLQYGAAYYPYLNTTIDFDYTGKEGIIKISHVKINADGAENAVKGDWDGKFMTALKGVDNVLYEKSKEALGSIPVVLPPSAAIAGVYARVDSERGVWKAPANVGIAGISGPSVKITDADQASMNIDAATGKSVNAIREVGGRGIVVWGARTLMGNNNEWRYVNVRRFFNYVEESVKKASYQFVFEPNDANTWVKVRAMIENFLTLLWRDGALQGAKPEQAFFVRVGLGISMTQTDILEGRMIIEIGMAVVRPAEFIVLRFSHKMPE